MPVLKGGFQKTACPKDRQDRSGPSLWSHLRVGLPLQTSVGEGVVIDILKFWFKAFCVLLANSLITDIMHDAHHLSFW